MLSITKTYKNYNDDVVTETFHFNLSKSELADMQFGEAGGLKEKLDIIINTKDLPGLMRHFKDIILKAYGRKTPDGRFEKSEELSRAFSQTVAFDELYMELATNDKAAADFINGILPKDSKPTLVQE